MELYKKFADIVEKKHQKKINISTLIDVGAYKGFFIKNLNQKKIIEVYLFEPQPYYFNYLNRKFKNKSKYKIFKIALSSKKKKSNFLLNDQISTSTLESTLDKYNLLYKIKTKFLKLNYFKRIIVQTDLLNTFFLNKNIKNSFLKIDTEGNDMEVLKGANKIIRKIDYIMVEIKDINFYNNNKKKDIYDFLSNNKFEKIKSFSTFPYIYRDVVFKKKDIYTNKK